MEHHNIKKWYIVQVVTGYEQKVKEDLENRDFDINAIEEILLPLKIYKTKSGSIKSKPMFPGYLYIKLEMTDNSWFIIRNTNYVTGIIGSSGQRTKPTPIREEEILKIKDKINEEKLRLDNIEENFKNDKSIITDINYKVGDFVKIVKGEFNSQEGKVVSISIEKQKVFIEIEFFGRTTTVELDLDFIVKK